MALMASSRMALPPQKCSARVKHPRSEEHQRCGRYAVPGLTVCKKHGAGTKAAQNKANAVTTLATLLADDPRPWHEALQDHINTLDAVARQSKVDALKEHEETGSISTETLSELLNRAQTATTVINASERTGILQRAQAARERTIELEARTLAHIVEYVLVGITAALDHIGLSEPDSMALKRWMARRVREAIDSMNERSQVPEMGDPPRLSELDHLTVVPRAELEALRDAARRYRPRIAAEPADVTPPDDSTHRAPPDLAPQSADVYPPGSGLLGTEVTTRYHHGNR